MTALETVPCPLCGAGAGAPVVRAGPRQMVGCSQCGLVYRNPRPPLLMTQGQEGSGAPEDEWLVERRGVNFHRFLDRWQGAPGRLLDVGCGYGWFLQLAKARGWVVVGVDYSAEAVRHARERLGVDARCGQLQALGFPGGAFDLVTLWNVLEFVPDPVPFLREVHRVLAPSGTLFIRTQNYLFQRLAFGLTDWLLRPDRPYRTFVFHANSFSPAPLRLLLGRTSFRLLRLANSPPTPGDPYRAFGGADRLLTAVKLGVHGLAQGLSLLSRGRWLLGPSLEVYARRGE